MKGKSEYLTKQEYERLKKEIERLETQERKKVADALRHAASFGDLSENAAFEDAKEQQRVLEARIIELKEFLSRVKVVDKKDNQTVQLGSTVTVKFDGETFRFQIVGVVDSNISQGKLSCESPLGKALLGKRTGQIVRVETPEGDKNYKILKIE